MNKRILVLVTLLILFVLSSSFGVEPVRRTGEITFSGFIQDEIYFNVEPLHPESINLLSDEIMPGSRGVDIGTWTLKIDNPPVQQTRFAIQYDYNPLQSPNPLISDEIAYVLIERDELGDSSSLTQRSSGEEIVIISSLKSGSTLINKVLSVALTDDGRATALRAAATNTYESNITISLNAD
ncbi:MAG: hypothetical protein ACOXZZ_00040 [Sphaerochaetaceae bacterium]|jgi:hypothetical protein|nr:hypothetical protein [Bacteroidia bacterium]